MCRVHFQVPCVAEEELPGVSVAGLATLCLLLLRALFLIEHLHTLLVDITVLLYWLKLLNYYVFLNGFSLNVSFILNCTSYKYKTLSLACTCSFVVCSSLLQQ